MGNYVGKAEKGIKGQEIEGSENLWKLEFSRLNYYYLSIEKNRICFNKKGLLICKDLTNVWILWSLNITVGSEYKMK